MKKILLSVFTVLSFAGSFAQSFITEHGDTVTKAFTTAGLDLKISNRIINMTNSPLVIDWHVVDTSINLDGWVFEGFCDNQLCYIPSQLGGNHLTNAIPSMDTIVTYYAWFNGDNALNNTASWIRIQARQQGNPIGTRTLTFIATKGTTSTVDVIKSEDEIVLYPNPAKNALNVIYNADLGVKNIGVYNLIGKMVSIYKVGNTSAKLDVNELPGGIYFLRLFDERGRVVATRKFTHQ